MFKFKSDIFSRITLSQKPFYTEIFVVFDFVAKIMKNQIKIMLAHKANIFKYKY